MAVAAACPPRFTGADMYALCSDAWTRAMRRAMRGAPGGGPPATVAVDSADFTAALASLQPSLSQEELARYDALRLQYERR